MTRREAKIVQAAKAVVSGRLLRSGNGLGVRIDRRDVGRLGPRDGAEVTLRIAPERAAIDLGALPIVRGSGTEGQRLDEILGSARLGPKARVR